MQNVTKAGQGIAMPSMEQVKTVLQAGLLILGAAVTVITELENSKQKT